MAAVSFACIALLAPAVSAQEPSSAASSPGASAETSGPDTSKPVQSGDYAHIVMTADAIAAALVPVGALIGLSCVADTFFESESEDDPRCWTGVGVMGLATVTYVFAPPIIHLHAARPGAALASFALRVSLPAAGLGIGLLADSGGVLAAGVVAGAFAAAILDWELLARYDDNASAASTVHLTLQLADRSIGLGAGAQF